GLCPLTRSEFLHHISQITVLLGLKPFKGHGIHIRGTLEYLLQGLPFEVVKLMGKWSRGSFQFYLCQHAIIK
ncbi:hypothetical protein BDN71DRAFT_1396701, partial [Pleurotus eryngii]